LKSFLRTGRSGRRTEKLKQKYRSRFKEGGLRQGNRQAARYRRNRQLLAQQITSTLLWVAIAVMLMPLGRSLWHVSRAHLSDRPLLWQAALPATAAGALVFCLLRARAGWRELRELRREQAELLRKLRTEIGQENGENDA